MVQVKARSNILIIDDSRISRAILEKTLSKFINKASFYHASNIDEAETVLKERSILLIFLDRFLSSDDGFNLLKKMRKNDDCTPVIITSSETQPEVISMAKYYGADDYITKPLILDKVEQSVRKFIKN